MLMLSKRTEKTRNTSPKSSVTSTIGRGITQTRIPRIHRGSQKLVLVSANSMPVTETREEAGETTKTGDTAEAVEMLEAVEIAGADKNGEESKDSENLRSNLVLVPCIRYPVTFRKKAMPVWMFFDLSSKCNAIHLTYAKKLDLPIRPTNVEEQKINSTTLDTFGMVVAAFSGIDKTNRVKFFEETFLVANVSPKVVLGMPFLTLSGANIDFLSWELRWRTYPTKEVFPTTRRIELVGKKKFAAAALDSEYETYVVYVGLVSSFVSPSSSLLDVDVHPSCKPQISGLIAKEAPIKVSAKYSDFADVFFPDLASKLPGIPGSTTTLSNWLIVSSHPMDKSIT